MDSDRGLLELAAKAAGIEVPKPSPWGGIDERGVWKDISGGGDGTRFWRWNPLTDDGDRYRLARSLKGNLYFSGRRGCFEIPPDSDEPPIIEYFDIGDEKAEAYAVVRAAATVGRNK